MTNDGDPVDSQPIAPLDLAVESAQRARGVELDAARARSAVYWESITYEFPDISSPIGLGTHERKLRGRGNEYETHGISEPQDTRDGDGGGEIKVTESSSAHPPFNPLLPPILSSFQPSKEPIHQDEGELGDSFFDCLENPSHDNLGFQETGPSQYDELTPPHFPASLSKSNPLTYTDTLSSQASNQANFSSLLSQGHCSSQEPSVFVDLALPSSNSSAQVNSAVPTELPSSYLRVGATISPNRQSSPSAFSQAESSVPLLDRTSDQNSSQSINSNRRDPQASKQVQFLLPPTDRERDKPKVYSQLKKKLNALIKPDGRSSREPGLTGFLLRTPQESQRSTSRPYEASESKLNSWLETQRQTLQGSGQVQRPNTPTDCSSNRSLPLSDTLRTASFNLETNQWDPDLPEADMSAPTPASKSTRGGHSGVQSHRSSSSRVSNSSRDLQNPHAIVTTTKFGRPYTNPYTPIDSPPIAANQKVKASSSRLPSLEIKPNDAGLVGQQPRARYIDQEEARFQALGQPQQVQANEPLEDPFQDQTTPTQQYGHNQPASYAEVAAYQAGYGQFPGYQPPATNYPSDLNPFFPNAQGPMPTQGVGPSPYHGQRSAYDQTYDTHPHLQFPNAAPQEQRSAYEEMKPRAAVRLPAVRGTTEQQTWPSLQGLSLEDAASKNLQDQYLRQTQSTNQPIPHRISHALPIRDPAAYTGSGINTRRNQEALRQNYDTIVASTQGPTRSARTVMNDPQRDRQLSDRPSQTATDTTVTGSTLRAQAPSYESVSAHSLGPTRRQGQAQGNSERTHVQHHTNTNFMGTQHGVADPQLTYQREAFQVPAMHPSFEHEAAMYAKSAGLPDKAIGAGNAFMNAVTRSNVPLKKTPEQRLEDAATWFRSDPRNLSYAASILPYDAMNKMNSEQFPLEDRSPSSVINLKHDSQHDDPSDRAHQAATPRPIGHGRPAGFTTPPGTHAPTQTGPQAPSSSLSGVASVNDKEGMERSGRLRLEDDAKAIGAMFGGVYSNLIAAKDGPPDYLSHYCPPPAYAIDHNPDNNDTFFDPQWFATAPPARVGRDPRREQGEYEDPTLGSGSRRAEQARGDVRRESGGRGGGGGRGVWGRN